LVEVKNMSRTRNNSKTTVIAIIILIVFVFFMIQFVTTGKLDVTSANILPSDTCKVVKECGTDCAAVCQQYEVCSVKTFENTQIACINGDKIQIQIIESEPNSLLNENSKGGGGQ
jgi:hypothetical protein